MSRRGFTLVEVLTGMFVMSIVMFASLALMITGTRTYMNVDADTTTSSPSAQAIREISLAIRNSMAVSLNSSGTVLSYTLPARSATADPVTGEKEFTDPLTSDGVARSYTVNFTAKTLTDDVTGRKLVRDLSSTDPQPGSSQYNMAYTPFQLTTIGSKKAISINLITVETVRGQLRYTRMKTTVALRNTS